jgi:hypothetical protein
MKKILTAISIFILSCSPKYGIERIISPVERLDVSVVHESALIRTQYCDMYMEYVDRKKWESVMKFNLYSNGKISYRIPHFSPYFITVKNAFTKPLKITGIYLLARGNIYPRLNTEELKKEFGTEQYENFNFSSLNTARRLLPVSLEVDVTAPSLTKINFEKDTVSFFPDYIAPEDIIVFFAFFKAASTIDNKYKIKIELDAGGIKKVIDFDFIKSEYRTEGKHFRNKGKIYENRQTDY